MRIQHNILAMNSNRWLGINQLKFGQNTERLSSGYRINRAADDAAGLSISEKMRAQIRGLARASKNIQEGISLIQTAEGALQEDHSILQRMRELSVQAANDTNTQTDRQAIQDEVDELLKEVDRIAYHTEFNNGVKPLLGASDLKSVMYRYLTEISATVTAPGQVTYDGVTYKKGDILTVTGVYVRDYNASDTYGCLFLRGWASFDMKDKNKFKESIINNIEYGIKYHNSCDLGSGMTIDGFRVDEEGRLYSLEYGYKTYYYTNTSQHGIKSICRWPNDINSPDVLRVKPDGTPSSLWIQTGANMAQGINLSLVDATASGIGLYSINVMSYTEANKSLGRIDTAIQKISEYRSSFGAQQNRLEHAEAVDDNTAENLQASESLIRDANMSGEIMEYAKNHILTQIGQVMLAQANQTQQGILNLLM